MEKILLATFEFGLALLNLVTYYNGSQLFINAFASGVCFTAGVYILIH